MTEGHTDIVPPAQTQYMHDRAIKYMLSRWSLNGNIQAKDVFRKMLRIYSLARAICDASTLDSIKPLPDEEVLRYLKDRPPNIDHVDCSIDLNRPQLEVRLIDELLQATKLLRWCHTSSVDSAHFDSLARVQSFASSIVGSFRTASDQRQLGASGPLSVVYRIGILIFCRSICYSTPFSLPTNHDLILTIERPAVKAFEQELWKAQPKYYLWIGMIAMAASRHQQRSSDFLPLFGVVMMNLGTEPGRYNDEVEDVVASFSWLQNFLEAQKDSLWDPPRPTGPD